MLRSGFYSFRQKEKSPTLQSYDILQPILATRASGSPDWSAKQKPDRHQRVSLHVLILSHMTCALYVLWINIKAMRYEDSKANFEKHTFSTILCNYFFIFSAPIQTGSGAHPASCTMGTGSFPGVKAARQWCWPHPLLVSRLRKSWAIPPLNLWVLLGLLRPPPTLLLH
jgi:hypothetical protein